jgi:hypothetical protein
MLNLLNRSFLLFFLFHRWGLTTEPFAAILFQLSLNDFLLTGLLSFFALTKLDSVCPFLLLGFLLSGCNFFVHAYTHLFTFKGVFRFFLGSDSSCFCLELLGFGQFLFRSQGTFWLRFCLTDDNEGFLEILVFHVSFNPFHSFWYTSTLDEEQSLFGDIL